METTRLSSKGQVVLPKSIREELDWPVGADLTVERCADSVVLRRKGTIKPTTIDEVIGPPPGMTGCPATSPQRWR